MHLKISSAFTRYLLCAAIDEIEVHVTFQNAAMTIFLKIDDSGI